MNKKFTLIIIVVAAIIIAGASVAYAQSTILSPKKTDAHSLVGSWVFDYTPDPGMPPPPFTVASAFDKDGTAVAADSDGSQLVGSWKRISGNNFATTLMGFQPIDGEMLILKARDTFILSQDGEELTGRFEVVVKLNDEVLAVVTGSLQGTRIKVEVLE